MPGEIHSLLRRSKQVKAIKSKRVLSLALAVMMAASLSVSVSAVSDSVGYHPDEDELLWWATEDLKLGDVPFTQLLPIDGVTSPWVLGYNTIQDIVIKEIEDVDHYLLVPHPQYFPVIEDLDNAQWSMEIYSILVWDGSDFVDTWYDGFYAVPVSYTQYNRYGEPYLLCSVKVHLEYVGNPPEPVPDFYDLELYPAYFQIPAGL
jgi:hypothetical protein